MKKWITASELMARLNADPEFVARQARQDEERRKLDAELQRAEAPLVRELGEEGIAVESVWDLVNTRSPYPAALKILLNHVSRPYPKRVREGIARSLAVPEARFAWEELVRLYSVEQEPRVKDGLAVALAAIADDQLIDAVIELARERRQGPSRLLLLSALDRSSEPRARAALMELGTDAELKKEIQFILRRRRKAKR